jgi:hypothetical protein
MIISISPWGWLVGVTLDVLPASVDKLNAAEYAELVGEHPHLYYFSNTRTYVVNSKVLSKAATA